MNLLRWRSHTALVCGWLAAAGAHAALPTVPAPVAEAAPVAVGAGGVLQAAFGMAMVLGLIFLCAWAARRFGLQRFATGNVVKVVSSSSLGQRERVVVVEIDGTWLVLGVTASQIQTLHTLPAKPGPTNTATHAAASLATPAALQRPLDLFAQKFRESLGVKSRPTA